MEIMEETKLEFKHFDIFSDEDVRQVTSVFVARSNSWPTDYFVRQCLWQLLARWAPIAPRSIYYIPYIIFTNYLPVTCCVVLSALKNKSMYQSSLSSLISFSKLFYFSCLYYILSIHFLGSKEVFQLADLPPGVRQGGAGRGTRHYQGAQGVGRPDRHS